MISLYPYQTTLVEAVRAELRAGRSRVLVVSPTGSGKTSLTAHMIAGAIAKNKRCWFLNHRRELVRQSVETLEESAGVKCGIISSGFGSNGYHLAQVASIQTLMRRWQTFVLPDLIICDEAHHIVSSSWSNLIRAIVAVKPSVKLIGLTATPERLDGRGLGEWFEVIVEGPSTAALIEQGYLSNFRMWGASLPDLTGVHTVAGDYNKADLSKAMSGTTVFGDALTEYRKHCNGARALAFLWSIQASKDLAQRFNDAGVTAMHVDGETETYVRDQAIAAFRDGRIKVLSNVELFGEGLDVPAVEAGFLMRPTQSLTVYLQQCGRLLRRSEGKEAALIFDHAGHAATHGYPDDVRPWTLDGEVKKSKPRPSPVRTCTKCYATLPIQAKLCRWCGTVFEVKERKVSEVEGELQELTEEQMRKHAEQRAARREQGMATSLAALEKIAKQRGYSPGWARHVWNAKRRTRLAHGRDDGKSAYDSSDSRASRNSTLFALADRFRPKKADG